MAKNTQIYEIFTKRLDEICDLGKHAETIELVPSADSAIKSNLICRGALLLLCGDVESYFMGLGELTFEKIQSSKIEINSLPKIFVYYMLRDKIDPIIVNYNIHKLDEFIDGLFDISLINGQNICDLKTNEFSSNYNNITSGISVPTFKTINKYFRRFGYEEFKNEFYKEHRKDANIYKNSYNSVIKLRHAIAHGADYTAYTPVMLNENVKAVRIVCGSIDSLFANWCGKNLCAIK